jgi:hypothetical protein
MGLPGKAGPRRAEARKRRGVCFGTRVCKAWQVTAATSDSAPIIIRNPIEFPEGVMPNGGARSATLERMNALSLRWVVRGHVSSWAVPCRRTEMDIYGLAVAARFLLPTFLCGRQRKVGAAPHRGEANRPIRIQGKANAIGTTAKTKAPQATTARAQKTTSRLQGKKEKPHTCNLNFPTITFKALA